MDLLKTPVLVVALSDQTHLEKAGTALERNPETSFAGEVVDGAAETETKTENVPKRR